MDVVKDGLVVPTWDKDRIAPVATSHHTGTSCRDTCWSWSAEDFCNCWSCSHLACSAASAVQFSGPVEAGGTTAPTAGGWSATAGGRLKASATTLSAPATWRISEVYLPCGFARKVSPAFPLQFHIFNPLVPGNFFKEFLGLNLWRGSLYE